MYYLPFVQTFSKKLLLNLKILIFHPYFLNQVTKCCDTTSDTKCTFILKPDKIIDSSHMRESSQCSTQPSQINWYSTPSAQQVHPSSVVYDDHHNLIIT